MTAYRFLTLKIFNLNTNSITSLKQRS